MSNSSFKVLDILGEWSKNFADKGYHDTNSILLEHTCIQQHILQMLKEETNCMPHFAVPNV